MNSYERLQRQWLRRANSSGFLYVTQGQRRGI